MFYPFGAMTGTFIGQETESGFARGLQLEPFQVLFFQLKSSNLRLFCGNLMNLGSDVFFTCDKTLTSCGPYKMKEDNSMVYRRPYLTSASSAFALNAISRAMKMELKDYRYLR